MNWRFGSAPKHLCRQIFSGYKLYVIFKCVLQNFVNLNNIHNIKCCGDTINIHIYICIIPKHIRRITKSNNPPNYLKTKKKHYLLKIQWYTYIYIYGSWAVLYKSSFVHLKYFLPNKSGNKHSTKRSAISRVPYWIKKDVFIMCCWSM